LGGGEFCLRRARWRDADDGSMLSREQLHLSAYVVRQIFAAAISRYHP
jgi:hypothetical protein